MDSAVDIALWLKAKKLAELVYKTPSAYKSGYIVKKYKDLGGKFKKKPHKTTGLSRWFKEKWVNQRGEIGYKHASDIYRPSKRITKKTPTTWSELTPAEITKARRTKSKNKRVDKFKV
jgi:hypothetical protein